MLEKYAPHFERLSQTQIEYLADAISHRYPDVFIPHAGGDYENGTDLMYHCENLGLDQADVVMSLAKDATTDGVCVIETLVGQPIKREAPLPPRAPSAPKHGYSTEAQRSQPRRRQSSGGARRSKSDPRIITAIAPNPKRPGSASHARYELYTVGMTVDQAVAAGLTSADIRHDEGKGFITLQNPGAAA